MKLNYKKDSNAINCGKSNIIFISVLLIWPLIHFAVFWIYINISTVGNSFFTYYLDGTRAFAGFENFKKIFTEFLFKDNPSIMNYRAITNTLTLIPLSLLINVPIMLFFAYFIFKKVLGSGVYKILLFIPAVISAVVICLVFGAIVANDGPFNVILSKIGLGGDGTGYDTGVIPTSGWLQDEKTSWNTILVFSVFSGISGYLIYFNSAMGRLPRDVFESAELDGASEVRQFFNIVVPMIWPIITTISLSMLSACFGWFMPSLLLTGGTNKYATTIGLIIVNQARAGEPSVTGSVSALAVFVSIVGGIVVFTFKALMERAFSEVQY